MEHPHFAVQADPGHGLLRIAMRGHWSVETVSSYRLAALKAAEALFTQGCSPGAILALVDARALGPQSQDVIAAYQTAFSGMSAMVAKLALITGSALFQLQAKRVGIAAQRFFADEAEALAWLLTPVDA